MDSVLHRMCGAVRAAYGADGGSTEDVLSLVNTFALKPLADGEFACFTLDLCSDQVDMHDSRFPREELARINEMVVGRPLMERHDVFGTLPRGTFFRSVLHEDGGVMTVRPDVYVLRTAENADFIRQIEGGVYREISIGFSFETPVCSVCAKDIRDPECPHVPGRDYNGVRAHYIMRNVTHVFEGSVVASGSQGVGFVEQVRSKKDESGAAEVVGDKNDTRGVTRRAVERARVLRMLGV